MTLTQYLCFHCGLEIMVGFLDGTVLEDVECQECGRRAMLVFVYGKDC